MHPHPSAKSHNRRSYPVLQVCHTFPVAKGTLVLGAAALVLSVTSCGRAAEPDAALNSAVTTLPITPTTLLDSDAPLNQPATTTQAEPATPSTTAPAPETTLPPDISADSRISSEADLADTGECRIADATPTNGQGDPTKVGSLGFPRRTTYAGNPELVTVIALPVGFADLPYTETDHEALVGAMDEVASYFEHVSYGAATVEVTIADLTDAVTLSTDSSRYGLRSPDGFADSWDVVTAAISRASASLELASYDVVVIETPSDPLATFWPQALPLTYPITAADGGVGDVVWTGGWQAGNWRSIAHETAHLWLGLEDLYDMTPNSDDYDGTFWEWDLMNSFRGASPELTAWNRFLVGWLDDSQVRCLAEGATASTVHFISPIEESDESPKAIVRPIDEGRVLVIESRRVSGYDSGQPGVLVYVMDTNNRSGDGPAIAIGELSLDPNRQPIQDRYVIAVSDSIEAEGVFIELLASDATGDLLRVTVR